MGESETRGGNLMFAVNGERFEVPSIDPSTTLLEFLRTKTRFKSAKLSCGEGGCGACVVLLSKYDPVLKQVEEFNVSSCLTLVCSLNGCSITTSEGLGNSKDGFHPIHQRFAGFHASQCGFCTPGMCMSLFSALTNANRRPGLDPPPGFSKLTVSEAERAIAGNLCRCTGYRSIADACKSFAADVDIEDLGINSFWTSGVPKEVKVGRLPLYNMNDDEVCTYPDFLAGNKSEILLDSKKYSWYSPVSLQELRSLLNSNLIEDGKQIKLVVGNTGTGYYKEVEPIDCYIDLRYIPELSAIRWSNIELEIGASVTISRVIESFKGIKFNLGFEDMLLLQKLADHMEKVASSFIRNTGSIGGNLVMAQRNNFPSDIATIFLAVGSTVCVTTGNEEQKISLEEFFSRPPLDPRSILLSIQVPLLEKKRTSTIKGSYSRLLFETYRAAPRPLGNALPYLNAAFLADLSSYKNGVIVNNIQLAFGSYGGKHALRAHKVEKYLSGKVLDIDVLSNAIDIVKESVTPEYGTSYPAYRKSLAVSFLFQFLFPLISHDSIILDDLPDGLVNCMPEEASENHRESHSDQPASTALLSSGKQEVQSSRDYYPVGEPMPKFGALLQASGEAVYVDDIPAPLNCLHGAFIYSTKPLARIKGIDLKQSTQSGVSTVISFKDIPQGGENVGAKTIFGSEPLFAEGITSCAGDRIALLVSKTQKCADIAARMAQVNYDTENLEPPILSVEDAVARSSFFQVPPFLVPRQVGDFSKGMDEADHQILSAEIKLESQYHFYMESQAALAVPDEDNCMVVYSSIQCPEFAHSVIAKCLGVPEHNIRVITRRVGGGFGGKAIRAMPVATACALAAHKLRRPVKIYVNRRTDMIITGGRHPMKISYSVGFKSNGKITALHLDILIDAGMTADISPMLPSNMVGALKKYNWGALSFDIKLCKTNHSSKSAMRGPGEVQGSFIAEAIIEHVASFLLIEADTVRNVNLHTFESLNMFYEDSAGEVFEYNMPAIWDKLAVSANLYERSQMIEQFNQRSRWKKRGISRVPIVHEFHVRPTPGKVSILPDGSIVVEVGGIELGQGLWTKVKQVTAYALSTIACDGTAGLVEKVRVIQADTLSLIQGGFTAGSTTSEASCAAVRLCCDILVERLSTVRKSLQEQMGSVNWDALIRKAYLQGVNLAASSYYVPDSRSMQYLNYGAAVSEVEVDILTGETKVLRADTVYDCGQSMNPAIDLGQIEGAFVQGIGFFMLEEYLTNAEGMAVMDGTWTYKIPTIDTIPRQFNVEVLSSRHNQKRVLSSKASGEPPLLLAASVHCATRAAIKEARKELKTWGKVDEWDSAFQLQVPAIMPVVKALCGLDYVERYLESLLTKK